MNLMELIPDFEKSKKEYRKWVDVENERISKINDNTINMANEAAKATLLGHSSAFPSFNRFELIPEIKKTMQGLLDFVVSQK